MIYKNYILGRKLSRLDIYIIFFCLLLLSLLDFFCYINIITSFFFLFFFLVNYGDLLIQIVIFVFYFSLIGINQKYMLFTYLKKKIARCPILNSYFTLKKSSHQRFSIKTLFLKFCNIYWKTPV